MKWTSLREGDVVDIIAPASASTKQELKGAIRYVEQLGLVPRVSKNIFKRHHFFSNSDEARFADLSRSLTDSKSQAIWCLRGGYGSVRLLPALAKLKRPQHCKLFIGLSDVTSLHLFLNQFWGWPTIHGPMLSRLGRGQVPSKERREVEDLIFGKIDEVGFRLKALNASARRARFKSSIVGGNLETISAGQGTPWQLETRGQILFIEEVNERGYRVDRRFQNLKQTGQLARAKAIVFGDFIGGAEPETGKKLWREAVRDLAGTLKIPVFEGIKSGHGPLQRPVPFHTQVRLERSILICQTGVL